MDTLMSCITLHQGSYLPPEIRKMIFDLQEECSCEREGLCNAYTHKCVCCINYDKCKARKHNCSCPYPTVNICRAESGHICICPSKLSGKSECIAKSHICTCGTICTDCKVLGHL